MRPDRPLAREPAPASKPRGKDIDQPLVVIVDDDEAVREGLTELIHSAGFRSASFSSTRELLESDALESPGCLILDVRMPGASGLDLQRHLIQNANPRPIIFLTAHGDIPMTVQAMKAGAVDFLTKPVRDQTLLDAVTAAMTIDAARRKQTQITRQHLARFERLTSREREVLREVARGRVNKQIAFDLGIREVTVKLHRSNVMRKMEVASLGELIRAWESLPASVREPQPVRSVA